MVSHDEDCWREALKLDEAFGDDAPAWVAERIALQMLAGDGDDVKRFNDIAERLQQLRRAREERWN